jgi:CheY-like chemotaxis protein
VKPFSARELVARVGTHLEIAKIRRESEERLREADRRKDEFLATLAHELRNPLAPIRTSLEIIRLGGSTAVSLEHVRGIMERQIGHMVHLIDDLMDVSRITTGKIQLQRQPALLSELVEGAVEATRTFVSERRVALTVHLPETPCVLDVDRTRFVQILSNLLHNAAKFTPPGGRIDVVAELSSREGAEAHEAAITVTDTGIGIAPELLPRMFDLFVQGKGLAGSAQGGLGIGLALVKRLVEMHGGRVEARSSGLEQGTQITIRLPVAAATFTAQQASPSSGASGVGSRVLIVDDNEDAARTLAMLVVKLGGESHIAGDGPTGLQAITEFRPHVVLLDIGMPGMDGYETCRRIRQAPGGAEIFVVALTGWGQEDDKQRALGAGFDLHLTKPADPAAVSRLLGDVERARTSAAGRSH